MSNILLVAENKNSIQLLEYITELIDSGNRQLRHKISQVKRIKKDIDRYPQLKLGNGEVITDINMIYFFLAKDNIRPQRQHDYGDVEDPYRNMSFEDRIIDEEIGYGDDGRPITNQDYEDERAYVKHKNGDDSEDYEVRPDMKEVTQRFNEKRGNIQIPQIRRNPVNDRLRGAPPKQQKRQRFDDEDEDDRYGRQPRHSKNIKSRKSEFGDESSFTDDDENIFDGKGAIEKFYMDEAKNKNRDYD